MSKVKLKKTKVMEDYRGKKILVTGAAGFIGFHLSKVLIDQGFSVFGIDNLNDYYDVSLKHSRLRNLGITEFDKNKIVSSDSVDFNFLKIDLTEKENLIQLFKEHKFQYVCNLAAQAGVRYSIENPNIYAESNLMGFLNILENCRHNNIEHLVYASTSSVYGLNTRMPLSEDHTTDHPMTFYAATKKANEIMAHSYSHLYKIPTTGLRFFTVYGPYGRPDMALFKFTKAILNEKPIDVYNYGNMVRDFTYVDDIVQGIFSAICNPPLENLQWDAQENKISSSSAPYRIMNIGNSEPILLMDYIKAIEIELGKTAQLNFMEIQAGDVPKTWADVGKIKAFGYKPKTNYKEGVKKFVAWYLEYYNK